MCYTSTGEVNFNSESKAGAMKRSKQAFADAESIDELDGVTISYGEVTTPGWWWVNVRASNTEPLLRMNLESDDRGRMEEMTRRVIGILGVEPEV